MKGINNEQILDTIYDLADSLGLRIDEFLERVEEEFGEQLPSLEGLPESIVQELRDSRESKKELRRQSRIKKSADEKDAEIKRFREIFGNVEAESIPESVWEDVADGASLYHAYALYLVNKDMLDRHAESVNARNAESGAFASSDGATEQSFTKEQVEKMSGKDVKSNYKNIIKAMKSWKSL